MACLRWVLILSVVAAPVRAGQPEEGWTHDLDLAAGYAGGAVTLAASEVTAFGLFGGLLRLGAGPRLLGVFGVSDLAFSTADADLISAGRIETFNVSGLVSGALNLALSLRVRPLAGLEIGANIDVVGVGFGRSRPVSSGGVQTRASPPTLNLLAFGRNDKGTLDSEFFLGWWFNEHLALRAGLTHVVSELVTEAPLQDGNDRFRRSSTGGFVAVSFRP